MLYRYIYIYNIDNNMAKNIKITNTPDLSTSHITQVLQSVFREYIEKKDQSNIIKEELEVSKLSDREKIIWRKALSHLTEARDLLYCCDSPFAHPRDQQKVGSLFTKFVSELKALK